MSTSVFSKRALTPSLVLVVLSLVCLSFAAGPGGARAASSFGQPIALDPPRLWHAASTLPGGRVLLAGGLGENALLNSSAVFEPTSASLSPAGSMNVARARHTAIPLPDGKVLIAGGHNGHPAINPLASAEIYDPATNSFSLTGSLVNARYNHAAAVLPDGRVLITGGTGSGFAREDTAEIYDPSTGSFTLTGSMSVARELHTSATLSDGRVMVIGGWGNMGDETASVEIYNSATGVFAPSGSLITARREHTATVLTDGRVLVTGGTDQILGDVLSLSSAEVFSPATGTFTSAGSMTNQRSSHSATLLPDGAVLLAGGVNFDLLTEVYRPSSGFTPTASMAVGRYEHTATSLPGDRVLLAGGNGNGRYSAEVYTHDPAPVAGETVGVEAIKGKVATRCRGEKGFTPLAKRDLIRIGCEVDTRRGTVRLTSARASKGVQVADFRSGIFKVSQKKGQAETTLTLTAPLGCGKRKRPRSIPGAAVRSVASIAGKRGGRKLWGKGKGRFTTKGNKGAANVRGTEWLVQDRCDGTTLFRVKKGVVAVRDFARRKTIKLKAGKSYVAGKKKQRR